MSKRDYYEVLGISKNCSEAELKKAYRRAAQKHHPDRNQDNKDAEEKFKECKEAYEILNDSQKRAAYDQFGHAGVDSSMGGGRGRGGGGQRVYRGSDLRYNLELSLEDAVAGTEVKIRIPTQVKCGECDGSGAKKGSTPKTCTTCGGHGQVRMQQGFFSVQQACPHCKGNGTIISDPCTTCRGNGRVQERKTLSVKVPAGVDTGDRIRLAGEGEAGESGGPPGDLYVQVQVKEHPIFHRDESNLYCEVPISFVTAALGGELEVPTLNGRVNLKIPHETQSGRVFRIRGKGVKQVRGGPVGDLLCKISVETPVNLTRKQKDILKEFSGDVEEGGSRHSPQASSWVDGVKKFFDGLSG